MMYDEQTELSCLDRPEVTMFLFYPRTSARVGNDPQDRLIMVDKDIVVGSRFHLCDKSAPNIVFFHGNGEIVDDYMEMASLYNGLRINYIAVDYRGYGHSTGKPFVSAMMRDCHAIFDYVVKYLAEEQYHGPLIVMGRSLGSASALELAEHHQDSIDGLIIESGFAYAAPLLQLMGINAKALGYNEQKGFRNLEKVAGFKKPVLIIHAEYDQIIPFSDGQAMFEACPAQDKKLLKINNADHNTIFYYGAAQYMEAVGKFCFAL